MSGLYLHGRRASLHNRAELVLKLVTAPGPGADAPNPRIYIAPVRFVRISARDQVASTYVVGDPYTPTEPAAVDPTTT